MMHVSPRFDRSRLVPGLCTSRPLRRCLAPGLSAALALLVGGCFTGEYNRRLEQSIKQIQEQVLYDDASPINDATGQSTGLSIRLPLFIDGSAQTLQPGSDGAQPPFVQLPGFAYGYEIAINQQPAYVYFAAVPIDQQKTPELTKQLQDEISKKFPSAVWRDVAVKSADGGSVTVKRLSVTGPQKFGGNQIEGRFDLYLYNSQTHHVLIGWRAPAQAASGINFFETAEQSVGSIRSAG